jgi:hypothetical protein
MGPYCLDPAIGSKRNDRRPAVSLLRHQCPRKHRDISYVVAFLLIHKDINGGQGQNRTADTGIFRRAGPSSATMRPVTYGAYPHQSVLQSVSVQSDNNTVRPGMPGCGRTLPYPGSTKAGLSALANDRFVAETRLKGPPKYSIPPLTSALRCNPVV